MGSITIEERVGLADFTTLGVGGVARFFVRVNSREALQEACHWARERNLPLFILGGGSNVLIADSGWNGLVIKNELEGIVIDEREADILLRVGAGVSWDELVELVAVKNWWGLEHLSGIPGSVGAAPIQNINAYGVSVGETIHSVTAYNIETDTFETCTNEQCHFGYRDSYFKTEAGKKLIITEVCFTLSPTKKISSNYRSSKQSVYEKLKERGIEEPSASEVRAVVLEVRRSIGMLAGIYNSAGSFFKNTIVTTSQFEHIQAVVARQFPDKDKQFTPWYWPQPDETVKISTAFLMECTPYNKTDFAGKHFNDRVGISPVHTLSLINLGDAQATDITLFAQEISNTVNEIFSITLEPEVCFISN